MKKKKAILFVIILPMLVCILAPLIYFSFISVSAKTGLTVVIDAGHGGKDNGVSGIISKTPEADLNLEYAFTLKKKMEEQGYRVIMTRTTKEILYSNLNITNKQKDMRRRMEIIANSGAELMISIHMNFYSARSVRGAQVFYNSSNSGAKELAKAIQKTLNENVNILYAKRNVVHLAGDYYILKQTPLPAVIVECGFLSNVEDEKLLLDKDYKELLCANIALGASAFLAVRGEA